MIFNDWSLIQDRYNAEETKKVESLFCLGNGYMCVRASDEEPTEKACPMTLLAGLFDHAATDHSTELANCVDVVRADITVNGQALDLSKGKTENYKKELNLYTGLLTRSFDWTADNGAKIHFESKRFVSLSDKHFVASKVMITALTDNVSLLVRTGIFSSNRVGSKHFESVDVSEDKYLYTHEHTIQTGLDLVVVSRCIADKGHCKTVKENGDIYYEYEVSLGKDETFKFQKRSRYCTVRDKDYADRTVNFIKEDCAKQLDKIEMVRFTDLHKKSADIWAEHWAERTPVIDTDNTHDIIAVRFAIYHLVIMTPAHDDRMNIGAKGMSGPGYAGHTFWDTEIYMLPYFIFEDPDVAKSLVKYRYRSLEGAHKKAAENGFVGAMFPWESAWLNDGEVTPGWARTGLLEHHITADVAQGVQYYYLVTGDEDFMEKYGYELIFDTALYWQNRVQWNEEKGRYEILCVIGPDEFREDVDNNAYTNYLAWYNMQLALTYYRKLKDTVLLSALSKKLGLDGMEERWTEVCGKLYLPKPNEDGIVPQDDTILSIEHRDLSEYKTGEKDFFQCTTEAERRTIQHSKQADVMVLFLLLEDLFTREVKKKNVYYYESVCLHGSSLSLSSYAMLCADIGEKEMAYNLFNKACRIDLTQNLYQSDSGIHAASLGGIWQDVVLGFMGLRLYGDKLRIQPNMPNEWRSAQTYFYWQGQKLLLKTTGKEIRLERITGDKPTTFLCNGKEYTFEDKFTLSYGE